MTVVRASRSDSLAPRPAVSADAARMCAVFRAARPESVGQPTVLGAPRATNHVQAVIATARRSNDATWSVATRSGGPIVGFLQLRRHGDRVVINQLHVHPRWQGRGAGRALLAFGLDRADAAEELAVDVFSTSTAARAWYDRLGFQETARTAWWAIELPGDARGVYVAHGLEAADVTQRAFGVSRFHVETRSGTWDVGRLGRSWFRLGSDAALQDRGLLAALRCLGPRRRILIARPDEAEAPAWPRAGIMAASARLAAPWATVRSRL